MSDQLADRATDAPERNQHDEGNEADLGTAVKGYTASISPVISIYVEFTERFHGYLGFGVGAGFALLDGDHSSNPTPTATGACLAATTVAGMRANCPRQTLDFNGFRLAHVAHMGFRYGWLGFRYVRGGPQFKSGEIDCKARSDLAALYLQIPL